MFPPDYDKPLYSKKAVNRAGDVLIDPNATPEQREEALAVLEWWRELHAAPLSDVDFVFHWPALAESIGVNVSKRLKRSESIIEKLRHSPRMRFSRMQDVAGFRCVFRFVADRIADNFILRPPSGEEFLSEKFDLKKRDDYVATPQESGYRCIHYIQEHKESRLLLELQVRTHLQHMWAMTVETVGMFYGQALKASRGERGWLDFFRLASAAISHLEKSPVVAAHAGKTFEEIRKELEREGKEKSFFTKLRAIKKVDEITSGGDYDYWLLELDIKRGRSSVYGFKADQIRTANEMYAAKEQAPACLRGDTQVVLVSTASFADLRSAYPSFFLDVSNFTTLIQEVSGKGTFDIVSLLDHHPAYCAGGKIVRRGDQREPRNRDV